MNNWSPDTLLLGSFDDIRSPTVQTSSLTSIIPIPTWLLKECSSVLVPTITNVVNLSLISGHFIPQNRHPSTDQQKIVTCDYVCGPTAVPNLVQIRPRELLGKCVKYNENFIYVAQLQPAQQQRGGLYVLLLFLIYFFGYFYRFLSDQLSQTLADRSSLNFTAGRTITVVDQCQFTFFNPSIDDAMATMVLSTELIFGDIRCMALTYAVRAVVRVCRWTQASSGAAGRANVRLRRASSLSVCLV